MIEVRKSAERGQANHGWLQSSHTFSFAGYYDPQHMGYRVLRVMNEDKVAPDNGFGTHPHDNMEIISYVVSGELEHKDSMGNGSVIKPGEFQIITAGTGITHSEFNPSKENETHFYQMWVVPERQGLKPSYGQKAFPVSEDEKLKLVASNAPENGALKVNQDVRLYKSELKADEEVQLPISPERYGWLQLVRGSVELDGETLEAGDGAAISSSSELQVKASSDSEFLFFDLP